MNHNLDPANIAVMALAAYFGSLQAAEVIGPYAIIFVLACLGAAWSIGSTKGLSLAKGIFFFWLITLTTVFLTFYFTQIVIFTDSKTLNLFEGQPPSWMMAAVALAISLIGVRWTDITKAVVNRALRFIQVVKIGDTK